MNVGRTSLRLLPLALAVSVLSTGCGSISKLVGGKKSRTSTSQPQSGASQLVSSFDVEVDTSSGKMTIKQAPAAPTAQSRKISKQATNFSSAWDISLRSAGVTYDPASKVFSGMVSVETTSETTFYNVKAVIHTLIPSDVEVLNAGVSPLRGTSGDPFYAQGEVSNVASTPTEWKFHVPSATSFRFKVAVFADVWSSPAGDGGRIMGLWFLPGTPSRGWAVGQHGKILHTTDGGQSWSAQVSNVSADLRDVCFVNGEQGWVIGSSGTILVTTNGGKTWRKQVPFGFEDYGFNSVAFTDPSTGCIVGEAGLILNTHDGGATWNYVFNPADGDRGQSDLYDVTAVPGTQGFCAVGGYAVILYSGDGGDNWSSFGGTLADMPIKYSSSFIDPRYQNNITAVHFVNASEGWIGGVSGLLYRTTDGGGSWERLYLPGSPAPTILDVRFANSNLGWLTTASQTAGGGGSLVYRTLDGGYGWQEEPAPSTGGRFGPIAVTDANNCWVGGEYGIIVVARNAGSEFGGDWSTALSGNSLDLRDVQVVTPSVAYAVGKGGTILRSLDGGRNWRALDTSPTVSDLNGLYFLDALRGWVVGARAEIYRTTDGGESWTRENAFTASGAMLASTITLNAVHMIDQNTGWVVGSSGTILSYTPAVDSSSESTWNAYSGPNIPSSQLNDVEFIAGSSTGFIVGKGGTIIRTDNGGGDWITDNALLDSSLELTRVATAPDGSTWIGGFISAGLASGGAIWKLQGNGSWASQEPFPSSDPENPTYSARISGITFFDANRGYAVGDTGTLIRTHDGGANWRPVPSGTTKDLIAVDFLDEDNGTVVGASGIIKTFH